MFMGTPEFAVPALHAVATVCDVALVVTQPDRPRGRGLVAAGTPVAVAAESLGLPVLRAADMQSPAVREPLAALAADVFAVVAFGAILTPALLALPRAGCVNLHGSLLPDYRGAAPVQRALWDDRAETGVCTLFMDEGIDTGDVIACLRAPILDDDDAGSLGARLAELGAPLLATSVQAAAAGVAQRTRQERAAGSYAKKLRKEDGVVDWSLPARTVWAHARAMSPWPGATTTFRGRRVQIVRSRALAGAANTAPGTIRAGDGPGVAVACGSGTLLITRLKPEGRAELDAGDWARGARLQPHERFELWKEQTT